MIPISDSPDELFHGTLTRIMDFYSIINYSYSNIELIILKSTNDTPGA